MVDICQLFPLTIGRVSAEGYDVYQCIGIRVCPADGLDERPGIESRVREDCVFTLLGSDNECFHVCVPAFRSNHHPATDITIQQAKPLTRKGIENDLVNIC